VLLGAGHDFEGSDGPRRLVVEDGEVLLTEGLDGLARLRVDDDIEVDGMGRSRGAGFRGGRKQLLSGSWKRGSKRCGEDGANKL
jgi:hypothetical protein